MKNFYSKTRRNLSWFRGFFLIACMIVGHAAWGQNVFINDRCVSQEEYEASMSASPKTNNANRNQRKARKIIASVSGTPIDLGLPSGTLWSSCNLGASTPDGFGYYYAYGDVNGYEFTDTHDWSMENWVLNGSDYSAINNYAGNAAYDAATYALGENWRTPNKTQLEELISSCSISVTTYNGINGQLLTGPNGNSIFLPASGYKSFDGYDCTPGGVVGLYRCDYNYPGPEYYCLAWNSDPSNYQMAGSGSTSTNFSGGYSIRPVYVGSATSVATIKDAFTIPSGVTLSISNSTSYPWENNSGTLTPGNSGIHSSDSYFTATITCTNNATLTFDWYVSSESGCDNLYYYVDGGTKTQISGTTSSASQTINLSAGTHTVTFGYKKDGSVNSGNDKGYVSNLKIQKEAVLPPGVVDLGLPSGTKWATCNLGATTPEEFGKFFAWGEVQGYYETESHNFSSASCRLQDVTHPDICGDPNYDAATYLLGSNWRLPSYTELKELEDNCSYTLTTQNGVYGMRFVGPNGNVLFLPAAGYWNGSSPSHGTTKNYINYWTGTQTSTHCAHLLYGDDFNNQGWLSYYGLSIRPVYVGSTNYLTINDTICSQGTTVNLPVNLTNSSDITEIGFVVELPSGITLRKNASNKYYVNFSERGEEHTCTARDVADGVKMAIVNMEGEAFTGNEGTIFTLPLQISSSMPNGNYTIRLKSVELSDGNLYETEDVTATITVTANRITMQNIDGYAGTTVQLPVDLTNRDAITEVGFVVELPEGITLDKNASNQYYVNFTERGDEHSATGRDVTGGVKFAILNMSGDAFTGNSGTIFTLPLQINSTLAEGIYPIRLKEIQLSDGNLYEIGDIETNVNVHRYTKGDVNNDGRIAVNDISLTIQAYLGNASADYIEYAGDMNDNNRIDVADISGVVSAYLSASSVSYSALRRASAMRVPANADNLIVESISANAGEVFSLEIGLNNTKAYTEIGGYISLPKGFSFVTKSNGKYDITLDRDRLPGHSVSTKLQANGDLKFAIVNMDGDPVEDNSGIIMTVKVKVDDSVRRGNYEVILHEIQLSDGDLYEPTDVHANVFVNSDAGDFATIPVTIGTGGYSTVAAAYNFAIPEGLEAYYATMSAGKVFLNKIEGNVVAAGEGIIVKGQEGEIFELPISNEDAEPIPDNKLVGVIDADDFINNGNVYVVATKNGETAFYKYIATTFPVGKAYLSVDGANYAKLAIYNEGDATNIADVENQDAQDVYNLQGVRVCSAQKGVYIKDGKKVFVK